MYMGNDATSGDSSRREEERKQAVVRGLSVQDVNMTFGLKGGKQTEALKSIDLTIGEGEFVALVGPSGCGKSTLLSIMAGLLRPSSGRVLMDTKVVEGPSRERGVLFQDYALFPWRTVRKNVEFGLRYGPRSSRKSRLEIRETVDYFIELVGLSGFEDSFPSQLSGGMRQRVALARLWAVNPEILLMDEPLGALDAQTRLIMQEELLRVWEQTNTSGARKTVVYVTHGIDEAVFMADRIAVMGTHPGHIKQIVDVDIPRPRRDSVRTSPQFEALYGKVWSLIKDEARSATRE